MEHDVEELESGHVGIRWNDEIRCWSLPAPHVEPIGIRRDIYSPGLILCIVCGRVFSECEEYIMLDGKRFGFCLPCYETVKDYNGLLAQCGYEEEWKKQKSKKQIQASLQDRLAIYRRDNYACLRCSSTENLVADHVIPTSRGGANTVDNLQTLCHTCNGWKYTKTIDYRKPTP